MCTNISNIFIDESCHLEHDNLPVMCIGYIKVSQKNYHHIKENLKAIKEKHYNPFELKWNKVSPSRQELYRELIDYFFENPLFFRCVIIKYKQNLDHDQFNMGSHDNFYYKMIYYLLRLNNDPGTQYRVFLDIKDTRGREKLRKIDEVFSNYYKGVSPFIYFQHIRSHENVFIQLADLFIGAITYKARGEHKKTDANPIKKFIVEYLEERSGYIIDESTEPWEEKFNIFDHQPRKS